MKKLLLIAFTLICILNFSTTFGAGTSAGGGQSGLVVGSSVGNLGAPSNFDDLRYVGSGNGVWGHGVGYTTANPPLAYLDISFENTNQNPSTNKIRMFLDGAYLTSNYGESCDTTGPVTLNRDGYFLFHESTSVASGVRNKIYLKICNAGTNKIKIYHRVKTHADDFQEWRGEGAFHGILKGPTYPTSIGSGTSAGGGQAGNGGGLVLGNTGNGTQTTVSGTSAGGGQVVIVNSNEVSLMDKSIGFSSNNACNDRRDSNNLDHPFYVRSACFKDGVNYRYYICRSDDGECLSEMSGGSVTQPGPINNGNNITTNTITANPFESGIDASILLKLKEVSRKLDAFTVADLKLVLTKLDTLSTAYSENALITKIIGYLKYDINQKIEAKTKNGDVDDFFCALTGDCDDDTVVVTPVDPVVCTEEAKLCSDGVTYVSRSGPSCEFTACPVVASSSCTTEDGVSLDHGEVKALYNEYLGCEIISTASCNNGTIRSGTVEPGPGSSSFYPWYASRPSNPFGNYTCSGGGGPATTDPVVMSPSCTMDRGFFVKDEIVHYTFGDGKYCSAYPIGTNETGGLGAKYGKVYNYDTISSAMHLSGTCSDNGENPKGTFKVGTTYYKSTGTSYCEYADGEYISLGRPSLVGTYSSIPGGLIGGKMCTGGTPRVSTNCDGGAVYTLPTSGGSGNVGCTTEDGVSLAHGEVKALYNEYLGCEIITTASCNNGTIRSGTVEPGPGSSSFYPWYASRPSNPFGSYTCSGGGGPATTDPVVVNSCKLNRGFFLHNNAMYYTLGTGDYCKMRDFKLGTDDLAKKEDKIMVYNTLPEGMIVNKGTCGYGLAKGDYELGYGAYNIGQFPGTRLYSNGVGSYCVQGTLPAGATDLENIPSTMVGGKVCGEDPFIANSCEGGTLYSTTSTPSTDTGGTVIEEGFIKDVSGQCVTPNSTTGSCTCPAGTTVQGKVSVGGSSQVPYDCARKIARIIPGVCGSLNGSTVSSMPSSSTSGLCSVGTVYTPWQYGNKIHWRCLNTGDTGYASCGASPNEIITGVCGDINGTVVSSKPSYDLCKSGTLAKFQFVKYNTYRKGDEYAWKCMGNAFGSESHFCRAYHSE